MNTKLIAFANISRLIPYSLSIQRQTFPAPRLICAMSTSQPQPRRSSRISGRSKVVGQDLGLLEEPRPVARRSRKRKTADEVKADNASNVPVKFDSANDNDIVSGAVKDNDAVLGWENGDKNKELAEAGEKSGRKKRKKEVDEVVIDEELTTKAEEERPWGVIRDKNILKVVTWNVASCRSVVKSGALMEYMEKEGADLVCLQETKMHPEACETFPGIEGYDVHWNHSIKKGYSGVAVFVRHGLEDKTKISAVETGMGLEEADYEGRIIRIELDGTLVIVNAYVPNSGGKLKRLEFRTETFEPAMRQFLDGLKKEGKRVIYCGDLNVAHEVIDIHNSKGNQKSAGHTPQEREQFSILLKSGAGWADSFRRLYPGVRGYTYYSRRFGDKMKKEGKGWRLDYHVLDAESFAKGVVSDIYVRKDVMGSDHYPLVLEYKLR